MRSKLQLSYDCIGSGKPIIFLHGLLGMKSNWRGIANAFSEKHTCILVDARNHGKSFHHTSHQYEDLAKDTLALIKELDLEEIILVGHSMGGKTLYQLTQYDTSRISAFCIVDILPVDMPNSHQEILTALSNIPLKTLSTRSQIVDYFEQQFKNNSFAQFLAKNFQASPQGFYCLPNITSLKANISSICQAVETKTCTKPCLAIFGEKSPYYIQDQLSLLSKTFPNCQIQTLKHTGHWVHAQEPKQFITLLDTFINQLETPL